MQLPGILKTHQPTPNRMSSADAEPGEEQHRKVMCRRVLKCCAEMLREEEHRKVLCRNVPKCCVEIPYEGNPKGSVIEFCWPRNQHVFA